MMRAARAAEEPVGPAGKMLKCLCCPHFDGLSDAAKPEPRFAGPPGGAPLAPEAVPEEASAGFGIVQRATRVGRWGDG